MIQKSRQLRSFCAAREASKRFQSSSMKSARLRLFKSSHKYSFVDDALENFRPEFRFNRSPLKANSFTIGA